jgi:hypothetical protein
MTVALLAALLALVAVLPGCASEGFEEEDVSSAVDSLTTGPAKIGSGSYHVSGINVFRGADQLIIYTPTHGATTGTNMWGAEASVVNGVVRTVVDRQSSGAPALAIPRDGVVLSGHGAARLFLLTHAKVGAVVTLPGQAPTPSPAPSAAASVTLGGKSFNVSGTNVVRGADQLIVYTPAHGAATGTNQWGVEVAVLSGRVSRIQAWQTGMSIPRDGYVLSGHGAAADFLLENAVVGGTVSTSNSTASGPATAVSNGLPMPFFGGYLAWWRNLLPASLPSQYNFLLYAFAEIDSAGNPRIPYGAPGALGTQNAARRAMSPPKYMVLSIGGANGVAQTPTTQTHEDNMVNGLRRLCDAHGFAGIDWDIETGARDLTNPAATARIVNISRRLRDHYAAQGKPFFITVAPYGSVEATYRNWASALWRANLLTAVNYQFYNGGSPPTTAQVRNKVNEWKALLPGSTNQHFSIGHVYKHAWPGALGSTTTSYTAMRDIWNGLKETHPGVAGTWAWDIGNQNADTDMVQFANVVYPAVGPPRR